MERVEMFQKAVEAILFASSYAHTVHVQAGPHLWNRSDQSNKAPMVLEPSAKSQVGYLS